MRLHKIWINDDTAGILWEVAELLADLPERQAKFYEEAFANFFDE